MPEDGKRYEAIDGELYVTPAPSRRPRPGSGDQLAVHCRARPNDQT